VLTETRLVTLLSPFADRQATVFEAFPETREQAAQLWATAARTWASQVTPASTTAAAAEAAFLVEMRTCTVYNDRQGFARAWHALATVLASGMTGWVAVAPPRPPELEVVYALGLSGGSNADCLHRLAAVLLAWFQTGTATLIAAPYTLTTWR
jgi:hypothetical protein